MDSNDWCTKGKTGHGSSVGSVLTSYASGPKIDPRVRHIFSSPEPKAHGELIVYQSCRRLCVRPSVRPQKQMYTCVF